MEFETFKEEFSQQIRSVSHTKLKLLMKELSAVTKERYHKHNPSKTNKVELVEKGFTDEEYLRFMEVVQDPQYRRAFIFMATLGLRPVEAAMLRGKDLEGDQLRIPDSKGGYGSVIRLPPSLLSLIPACEPEELLFNKSVTQFRKYFRECREKAGLNEVYAFSKPCGPGKKANPQYRLTVNSFRHYAIQKFANRCRDPDLTRRFARHRHQDTTEKYLRKTRKAEVEEIIEHMCETSNDTIRTTRNVYKS